MIDTLKTRKALTMGVIMATVLWSMMAAVLVAPMKASAAGCVEGRLVKGSLSAVYYCNYDGKRLPFSSEATYFTWYSDFSQVWTISDAELAAIQLGAPVTPRPGIKMVKIQSDPKVYAVARGAELRWIQTEALAAIIFGADWNKKVLDVSDALFTNFRVGTPVSGSGQYYWFTERDAAATISADVAAKAAVTPSPSGSPTVVSVFPSAGAMNVPLSAVIYASFSEAMQPLSVDGGSFTLRQGNLQLAATVVYEGQVADGTWRAALDPSSNLSPGTTYTAIISTAAKDASGVPLAAQYSWSFTTEGPAPVPPSVIAHSPTSGATGVLTNSHVNATFDDWMDGSTVNSGTFLLKKGSTAVQGTVTYHGPLSNGTSIISFAPSAFMEAGTTYTATITTGVKDKDGVALASAVTWTFTTQAAATAPTVISKNPGPGTNPTVNTKVTVTFSEAMDPATIHADTFVLWKGSMRVPGTVTYANLVATFDPTANLQPGVEYAADVYVGIKDMDGTPLAMEYYWTFTTATYGDGPVLLVASPAHGAVNVDTTDNIGASMSEPLDPDSVTTSSIYLRKGSIAVSGTAHYTDHPYFNPSAELEPSTTYTAYLEGVTDVEGNPLAGQHSWTFTTGLGTAAPPTVFTTDPQSGSFSVGLTANVNAYFNEKLDHTTVNTSTFILKKGEVQVSGTAEFALSGNTVTFNPSADLDPNTVYVATLTTGIKDLSGTPMASDYSWNFTTESN